MSRLTRTVLVDQNQLFREGLRRILSETAFRVARDSATLEDVLKGFPDKTPPQLLLLSAGPDYTVTAGEVQRFKITYPDARVVVLSEQCDFDGVMAVLRVGADGFVLKRIDYRTLAKSLELVMLGQSVLSSSIIDLFGRPLEPKTGSQVLIQAQKSPSRVSEADRPSEVDRTIVLRRFSSREADILDCLTRGEANKLIARKFDIAESTVKVHIKAILRKIQVRNRTQAAIWAQHHLSAPGKPAIDTNGAAINGADTDP